jgi:hypothetical protein
LPKALLGSLIVAPVVGGTPPHQQSRAGAGARAAPGDMALLAASTQAGCVPLDQ